jgi:hypothetical protein
MLNQQRHKEPREKGFMKGAMFFQPAATRMGL